MDKIYIVEGSTGEYSDHCEWQVAAYYSRMKAEIHVLAATQRANELQVKYDDYYRGIPAKANEHDPGMQMSYTGVRYRCYGVEIKDRPEEAPQ